MSQRYFLTTESAYEALRLALDADLGYPTSAATSIFTPALEAPRDSLRRIVLAVDDSLPHYAEIIAKVEPLLASASAQELTEAEYLAFLVCVSEGGGVPLAHAASHAAGGVDQLFDQNLNTTDSPEFAGLTLYGGDVTFGAGGGSFAWSGFGRSIDIENAGLIAGEWALASGASLDFTQGNATLGTTSGLVLKTGADGVIEALAQGTAGQVLKVNSGATGVEWGSAAADVSIDTTAADILSASSGSITADDPGADRLVFWDDSSGKLTHLTVGTGLTITDTTITSAGSTSASDLTSGTLDAARLSTNAQAAINLYLWSAFR